MGGSIQLAVHAVTWGTAWLWLDDTENGVKLLPGEITLVRGGSAHHIGHELGVDCLEPDDFRAEHSQSASAADPAATVFLCGAYQFSGDVGTGLLDALLVLALRSDFRRSATAPRWYRASADPRLRAALQAMHKNAGHPWTVPELAAISGLSRAAFARVFRDTLGQAPLQYLTDWRMTLARDHLRTGELNLASIAEAVGYGSPYAFAAAFRRHHGVPPGAWRHQHAMEPLTLNGGGDSAARAKAQDV